MNFGLREDIQTKNFSIRHDVLRDFNLVKKASKKFEQMPELKGFFRFDVFSQLERTGPIDQTRDTRV